MHWLNIPHSYCALGSILSSSDDKTATIPSPVETMASRAACGKRAAAEGVPRQRMRVDRPEKGLQ